MEFSQQGKYITVQITSADTPNGVVFGYNFRGVRAYECVACGQNRGTVMLGNKKRELKKIIDRAVAFFEGIKYDEAKVIQNNRFDEEKSRLLYEREIATLRAKGESLFQLELF
jgi:hypothetical protein